MERRYLVQLLTFNKSNPMQALEQTSVEGNSLLEIASKIPLMIVEQLRKEHNEIEEKLLNQKIERMEDDIPF